MNKNKNEWCEKGVPQGVRTSNSAAIAWGRRPDSDDVFTSLRTPSEHSEELVGAPCASGSSCVALWLHGVSCGARADGTTLNLFPSLSCCHVNAH